MLTYTDVGLAREAERIRLTDVSGHGDLTCPVGKKPLRNLTGNDLTLVGAALG